MKKILTTLVAVFAIAQFCYAQWQNGTNIYNTNSGYVGIGTTSPSQLLEVNGGYSLLNGLRINGADNANSIYSNSDIGITTAGGSVGLHILQSGIQYFTGGNIGIGTTSPPTVGSYGVLALNGRGSGQGGYLSMMVNGTEVGAVVANSQFGFQTASGLVTQFYTGSTPTMQISGAGKVGIGTTNPAGTFHVSGPNSTNTIIESTGNTQAYVQFNANGNTSYIGPSANNGLLNNISNGDMVMRSFGSLHLSANNTGSPQMTLTGGFVGIGTTTPHEALSVNGNIRSKQVKVETNNWPDYVFKPNYSLPSLKEVKTYIDKYQHLPDMPSEAEVAKDGLNLGEINKLLAKKVEELTLYLIEEHNKNNDQQNQLTEVKRQLADISKTINKNK